MAFKYVAISPGGEEVQGQIDVASEAQAERALWDANYRVISIREERKLPGMEKVFPSLYGVKKRALITFSRQLATLLRSGVPVLRSLELLEEQSASKPLTAAIRGISRDVRGGSTLADATRAHPTVFPTIYPRMVELGERTGQLEDMLATWRSSFRPEKADTQDKAGAKSPAKPAASKPAAKSTAGTTKASAAKTTKSTAAKTST